MDKNNKQVGSKGEEIAADYLTGKGYEIIERNYRYGHGEIDIIAKDKCFLVFVEVKTRNNKNFGAPELSVSKSKQKQIRRIAEAYLYEKDITDTDCRLDVIGITYEDNSPVVNHIENAF